MSDTLTAPAPSAPAAAPVAAPVATPEAPAPILRPDNGPPRTTLAETIATAKAGQLDTGRTPHHAATQPRADDGTFVPVADPAAPVEGAPDPAADPATVEGAPAADEGAEAEYIPFVLSGHAERGEEDVILEFPNDPVVQERLKRLANDGMRKRDYDAHMQQIETTKANVQAFETRLQIDPASFVAEYVPQEMLKPLVLSMLANDPAFLDAIRDDLAVLDDDGQRRRVAAEAQLALHAASQNAQATIHQRAENRALTKQLDTAIRAVVPATLNDAQQDQWVGDALREVAGLIQSGQLDRRTLSPHALPAVLQARFQGWGITDAAARIANALSPSQPAPSAPRVNGAPKPLAPPPANRPGTPVPAAPASRTPAQIQAGNAARQAAAQTGGPGVAAPIAASLPALTGPNALERTLRAAKDRQRAPLLG